MGRKPEPHSIRTVAAAVGLSRSSLHRLKRRHGLNLADKPALTALLNERNRHKTPKP
jgi:hypothetical protein